MILNMPLSFQKLLQERVVELAIKAKPSHAMRVDDIPSELLPALIDAVNASCKNILVFEMNDKKENNERRISADKAVEFRNAITVAAHIEYEKPLMLFVAPGNEIANPELSAAGSSTGNSFEQIHVSDIVREISAELEVEMARFGHATALRNIVDGFKKVADTESWAFFLAEACSEESGNFGKHLWRIGLVPDYGNEPESRIRANVSTVRAISFPTRPGQTLNQRLQHAGLILDSTGLQVASFLADQRGLNQSNLWCEKLGQNFANELTFEKWPLKLQVTSAIESVVINSFRKANGELDRSCKLKITENDELVCEVDPAIGGKLAIKWTTKPRESSAVARWHVDIVYPSDMRHEDSAPIASHSVKGSSRTAAITINVSDDVLVLGTKFVARLHATDAEGQLVSLKSGELVGVDSDEFDIVLSEEPLEQDIRKANAATLPEAVLRAVHDGLDAIEHDSGNWDSKTQVFSIKLSARRQTHILISRLSAYLQRHIQANEPARGRFYSAVTRSTNSLDLGTIADTYFDLPDSLARKRREFLEILKGQYPRNFIEVAIWNDELTSAANEYVAAYRRALDSCDEDELRKNLLQLDSFTLRTSHSGEVFTATILLPLHPLRIAWFKSHNELLAKWTTQLIDLPSNKRKNLVDLSLISRITPANLPFSVVDANGSPALYLDEIAIGTAVYFPVGSSDLEMKLRLVLEILGLDRASISGATTAGQLLERITAYSESHGSNDSLSMLVVNPGEGRTLSSVLRQRSMKAQGDDLSWQGHVKVTAYSSQASFAKPIADLQVLQSEIKSARTDELSVPFVPLLGLSSRSLENLLTDDEPVHIGLIHGLISNKLTSTPIRIERASALGGLISPLAMIAQEELGETVISSYPSLQIRGTQSADEITSTHRAHQSTLGLHLGLGEQIGIASHIDPTSLAQLGSVHARSDWVISIDRHLGATLYDLNFLTPEGRPYLLDYAPDFIDGIGDRITVTTSKRREVDRLIKRAMLEMGLYGENHEPEDILDALAKLSGRLALRLTTNTTQASEVVGLAALMMHLEDKGNLEDAIVVPLDSHPEIFGHKLDDARDKPLRCDIMLVRLTARSFKIELIEVKNRKGIVVPRVLCDHISEQLHETKKVLMQRYFGADEGKLDVELQWAKLTSMLHFYADRSFHSGQVDFDKLSDLHRLIDRLEESRQSPEITMRGYVISLAGKQGFPEFSGDVPIGVLTPHELGRIGITTLTEAQEHETSSSVFKTGIADGADDSPVEPALKPKLPSKSVKVKGTQAADDSEEITPAAIATSAQIDNDPTFDDDLLGGGAPVVAPTPKTNLGSGSSGTATPLESVIISLGHDNASNVVTWKISTEGSPHAFILGIPGQGKSVTTRRIMHDFADQNLPAIVFDFHGDMAANPPECMRVFDATNGLPFSPFELMEGKNYTHASFEIREILAVVGGLGEIQGNAVYQALLNCYKAVGFTKEFPGERLPTIDEFVLCLSTQEAVTKVKNVQARLTPLTDFDLFDEQSDVSFNVREGKGMIIDLSGLGIEAVQMAAGSFILRKIYKEMFTWDQDKSMKLAIVLDEAHRLAKDVTLPKIMKEGRKYGISVIVASQGLEDFSQAVISNAGTKIAFRCNFPSSRKVGGLMRGPKNADLSEKIETLKVGQAFVSTPEHTQARRVFMFGDDDSVDAIE